MCCITLFPVSKSSKSTEKRYFSAFLRDNLHTYSIQVAWVVQARRQPDNHHLRPQCSRLNNFVAFDQNLNLTSHWRQMVFFFIFVVSIVVCYQYHLVLSYSGLLLLQWPQSKEQALQDSHSVQMAGKKNYSQSWYWHCFAFLALAQKYPIKDDSELTTRQIFSSTGSRNTTGSLHGATADNKFWSIHLQLNWSILMH